MSLSSWTLSALAGVTKANREKWGRHPLISKIEQDAVLL